MTSALDNPTPGADQPVDRRAASSDAARSRVDRGDRHVADHQPGARSRQQPRGTDSQSQASSSATGVSRLGAEVMGVRAHAPEVPGNA